MPSAAGLGYIGAGAGLAKQGLRYGAAPGVAPDAQALAIINSNQLRRSGIGAPTIENAASMPRGPLKELQESPYGTVTVKPVIASDLPPGSKVYELHQAGKSPGFIHATVNPANPRKLIITAIGAPGGSMPNSIGTAATRDIMRQLSVLEPDIQEVGGTRLTGARREAGLDPSSSSASIRLRSPETSEPKAKRSHSDRLIRGAKVAGATGIRNKSAAATWIAANLGDENRAAIAKELGVKPGPKFQQRVLTAVKNMAKKPGASALVPALAGGTAFLASPESAEASRDDSDITGRDEALTNAGIAGGLAYGTGKVIESIPKIAGRALSGGLSMLTPSIAADAYDPSPEKLAMDRNELARILPEWMHLGAIEKAHQMAQVPERSPVGAGPRLAEPADPDAAINEALGIVRRANGGRVSGGFHFDSGGRTDNIPIDVIPGSYIVPADVVSALGQGNTMAGIKVLDNMFPPQMEPPKAQGTAKRAEGGRVPIIVAGGEFKVDPYHVAALGEGDVQAGADMLDEWVQDVRQQHIQTLSKLPGPAESAAEEGRQRSPFEQGGMAVSEEDILLGFNPIDELRRTVNAQSYTPEQAAENRQKTVMELLYSSPIGNALSARDALEAKWRGQELEAGGDQEGARKAYAEAAMNTGMAFLPGMGRIGLGRGADTAATAGKDAAFAIPVWHGSPHEFNRFDMSSIGTGEGAQAYGHGLYFAENPRVAKSYMPPPSKSGMNDIFIDKKPIYFGDEYLGGNRFSAHTKAHHRLRSMNGDLDATIADLEADIRAFGLRGDREAQDQLAYLNSLKGRVTSKKSGGHMYRVELDVEPEDLLDWDKPLSQQSEKVRAALAKAGLSEDTVKPYPRLDSPVTGETVLSALQRSRGIGPDEASALLREAGIPGIRYLDQLSRGAGQGSSNYVIFDDKLAKVLAKVTPKRGKE